MKISTSILMGGLIAIAGSVLYDTTFEVQELENRLSHINRQIVAEREIIQVLNADWSLLNNIVRVEELSQRYLPGMRPAEPPQFVALKAVPARTPPAAGSGEPQLASLSGKADAAPVTNGGANAGVAARPVTATPVASGQRNDGVGSLIDKIGGRE